MSRYRSLRTLGTGPDGPVEEVVADRLGAEPLARRRVAVPAGARRHRLRDAAEALARSGHAGLATVVDLVDVDESCVEIVRTLGTDGTLADRGPRPAAEVRDLLEPVADALRTAHGAGVAHGRLTTANVLLCGGRPLLADFGLTEARTGRPVSDPFRADVRALATMGIDLLDPAEATPEAAALRTLLLWAADDPDATLDDLCRGLDTTTTTPAPSPTPAPPPPPTVLAQTPSDRRHGAAALAGSAALALGLLAGSAAVLVPGLLGEDPAPQEPQQQLARSATCPAVQGPLRADVDGDGCDDPVQWQAEDAEVAYPGADGALLRFRVGRPGDDLVLGDWDCDGVATAAVVRTETGETYLFDAWAADGQTLAAEPGPALPAGAAPLVVDNGGCDRIEPAHS